MIKHWLQQLQGRRERAALVRRAIPHDLWKRTLVRYPFLQRRSAEDAAELRRLTSLFLDSKEFSCTGGLRLTDAMAVSIAAQAALPVLRFGLSRYDSFVGIVVHPDAPVTPMSFEDDAGVVHEYEDTLLGSAVHGGPVVLSWPHVRRAGQTAAASLNVVIHEFVHVMQHADGAAGGTLPLPPEVSHTEWRHAVQREYQEFAVQVEREATTVLDPYGATSLEEFVPVACEAFFVNALQMQKEHPALYGVLCQTFLQDPATDQPPARRT